MDEQPRPDFVWARMDAQETRRLTEGRLAIDVFHERWPWAARIVRLAFAVALVVGIILREWRVVQVVVTAVLVGVIVRASLRAEGRRRQRQG